MLHRLWYDPIDNIFHFKATVAGKKRKDRHPLSGLGQRYRNWNLKKQLGFPGQLWTASMSTQLNSVIISFLSSIKTCSWSESLQSKDCYCVKKYFTPKYITILFRCKVSFYKSCLKIQIWLNFFLLGMQQKEHIFPWLSSTTLRHALLEY